MFDKVRLSLTFVGLAIGPHFLYCVLCLLKLIFKVYKDLIPCRVFYYMYML